MTCLARSGGGEAELLRCSSPDRRTDSLRLPLLLREGARREPFRRFWPPLSPILLTQVAGASGWHFLWTLNWQARGEGGGRTGALVALLAQAPDELGAVVAERWAVEVVQDKVVRLVAWGCQHGLG